MGFRKQMRTDRGMTLPEVMIASSVLLVCLTALASLLGTSVNSSHTARMRDEAANLANERVEVARSLPYDSVGIRYANGVSGDPAGQILTPETVGNFVVTTSCSWVRTDTGRAAYKKLTVSVAWQQPSPGHVDVTTMVYGKSNLATTGDLLVKIRTRENGDAVQDAPVTLRTSDNQVRAVSTDSSGEAFFGQATVGAAGLSITPPAGTIVDTSTLQGVAIAPDAVSTVIVYIQKPAKATIHVVDPSGAAVPGASVAIRRADGGTADPVVTDASGDAVFDQLLYADYAATVSMPGYTPASMPFTVDTIADAPVVPFTMSPAQTVGLHVRVFDGNGTQMPDAMVQLFAAGGTTPLQQGTTGSSGEMSFAPFGSGSYTVSAAKGSYVAQTQSVSLADGDTVTLDFHLTPALANGNMSITTLDKNGHAGSIRVTVSGSGYYRDDLWSGTDGALSLSNLVPGSYQVQCYTNPASSTTIIVNGGQTAYVTVAQSK